MTLYSFMNFNEKEFLRTKDRQEALAYLELLRQGEIKARKEAGFE